MADSKKSKKKKQQLPITFILSELDLMINYIFTDSEKIQRKQISNMNFLLNRIDVRRYQSDEEMISRIEFLKACTECILDLKSRDCSVIYTYALNKCAEHRDYIENTLEEYISEQDDLKNSEIDYITQLITDLNNYSFIFKYKDDLSNLLEEIDMGEYANIREINNDMKDICQSLLKNMRESDVNEAEYNMFGFDDDEDFITEITDMVTKLQEPSNYLRTGLQGLNSMLGEGFESGRLYMFLGAPSQGKSLILLCIAYWIAKCNTDLLPENSEKKKCVIYVTQENTKRETLQRLWNIAVSDEPMKEFTPEEVVKGFRDTNVFNKDNNCELKILYRKIKTLTVEDLHNIINELEEEGYEVIAMVHDYLKRLKPSEGNNDLRIDLGDISNEEAALAKIKNIPFITASQLNRVGIKTIETNLENNVSDIGKKLNASDIGESMLIVENSDWVTILNREYKASEDRWYLTLKNVKDRPGTGKIKYFAQPFSETNGLRLEEDIDLPKPLYREALSEVITDANKISNSRRTNTKLKTKKISKKEDVSEEFDEFINN